MAVRSLQQKQPGKLWNQIPCLSTKTGKKGIVNLPLGGYFLHLNGALLTSCLGTFRAKDLRSVLPGGAMSRLGTRAQEPPPTSQHRRGAEGGRNDEPQGGLGEEEALTPMPPLFWKTWVCWPFHCILGSFLANNRVAEQCRALSKDTNLPEQNNKTFSNRNTNTRRLG